MVNNLFITKVLWSHVDANRHVRHSAYADFCAQARISILESAGFTLEILHKHALGPILFREELLYLREIKPGEDVKVVTCMVKCKPNGSRWSFRHELFLADDTKAAIVNVDGAWIDLSTRKLASLPKYLSDFFNAMPRGPDFEAP